MGAMQGMGAMPGMPGAAPGMPGATPGMPAMPGMPGMPGMAGMPGMPGMGNMNAAAMMQMMAMGKGPGQDAGKAVVGPMLGQFNGTMRSSASSRLVLRSFSRLS